MNELNKLGKELRAQGKRLEKHIRTALPRKVGIIATSHYRDNFRQGGFVDGGLKPWKPAQRQGRAKGVLGQYGPLLSKRTHLMRSIRSEPGNARVKIINDVPYARIHNEGGTTTSHPQVTPKMRRFAWAMFYKTAGVATRGKSKGKIPPIVPEEAQKWRAMALTRKKQLTIVSRIPKRQFMGPSKELKEKINDTISKDVKQIIDL